VAESTLSIQFSDLQKEVGAFLGIGVDATAWTAAQTADVDRFIQSGIRQFYFPPAVNGVEAGYEWSFLKPTATVDTVADQGVNDLPDALGRVVGDLHFAAGVFAAPIIIVSEARILSLLQQSVATGRPKYAAVRIKTSDGTTGQRQEFAYWPVPNAVYTLTYRYEAFSGKLTAAKPYPLGGMRHSELIIESCLAIAEQKANDEQGVHAQRFAALLAAGIAQDRRAGAKYYGQMGCQSGEPAPHARPVGTNYSITYKGETW
jgi:hypothetical protein